MQSNRFPFNPPGKKLAQYRFQNEIGRGNNGIVYMAINESNNKFAIKCLKKEILQEKDGQIGYIIKNEKNALLQIKHKHVIRMIEYIESVNQVYMVFELCDKGNFEDFLKQQQFNISIYQSIQYFKQIIDGIQALHKKHIIHRDLKLSNILIKEQNTLKIVNLGHCRILNDTEDFVSISTTSYGTQAPEILLNNGYNILIDMFQAGIIFYQLLSRGSLPFGQSVDQQQYLNSIYTNYNKLTFNDQKIPESLQQLVISMLQPDTEKRIKWSELYKHKIFEKEWPALKIEEPLGYFSRINAQENSQIYIQDAAQLETLQSPKFQAFQFITPEDDDENNPQSEFLKQEKHSRNESIEYKEAVTVSFYKLEDFHWTDDSIEKKKLFNKYVEKKNILVLYHRLFELLHNEELKIPSPNRMIFPLLFINKKMMGLQDQLLNKNIFNSDFYDQLNDLEGWNYYKEDLCEEKEFNFNQFLHLKNTINKNIIKIQKYSDKQWEEELVQYQTKDFQIYFNNCMKQFQQYLIQLIFQEKQQDQESKHVLLRKLCFIYLRECLIELEQVNKELKQNDWKELLENNQNLNTLFDQYFSEYSKQL